MQLALAFSAPAPLAAPIARNSDPGTSHAAAREQTKSGRRDSHCSLLLELIAAHPGSTYRELHRHANGRIREAVEVQRRCDDLAPLDPETGREYPDSLVVRRGSRKCTVSGRPAQTWWLRRGEPK